MNMVTKAFQVVFVCLKKSSHFFGPVEIILENSKEQTPENFTSISGVGVLEIWTPALGDPEKIPMDET